MRSLAPLKTILASFYITTGCLLFIFTPTVHASINLPPDCSRILFNRCFNSGYFTGSWGQPVSGDNSAIFPLPPIYNYADNPFAPAPPSSWSFPAVPGCQNAVLTNCTQNATYANTFIQQLQNDINGAYNCPQFPLNATDACGQTRVKALGAAMIINTMYPAPNGTFGTDFGNAQWGNICNGDPDWYHACYEPRLTAGINRARANFAAWAQIVRDYDAAGLVNWDTFQIFPSGHPNSTGMNFGTDDEFFNNTDETVMLAIQFKSISGTILYTINRACGNIEGAVSPLPPLPPPPPPPPVVKSPYLRVYGGDVLAGSGFENNCSANANASIIAYNQNSGTYNGAGAQFGAQAVNNITQFASAALRAPPNDLSFANTAGAGDPTYGGDFRGAVCVPNYYGSKPASANTIPASVNVHALGEGKFFHSGDITLVNDGVGINDNIHTIIYVDGNVTIKTDIKYRNNTWKAGELPSFYLIVRGNIYIDHGIDWLEGAYIAQPKDPFNPADGNIYTCSDGNRPVTTNNSYYDTCNNDLSVYGVFIANRVVLGRTKGTLASASQDHSADANIAEKFYYSPELWMEPGPFSNGELDYQYDSITGLPPIL